MTEVRVKVADLAVASAGAVISTVGLGSCVAIVLHDASARVGGLAHILLPSPELSRETGNPAKFPETAVPVMLDQMRRLGAHGPYTAKLVGGASMFGQLLPTGGINMGERNIVASRATLAAHGIAVVAEDVGGDAGRSVYVDPASGRVVVRSLRTNERVL